jgi:hypothetical protein
MRSQQRGEQHKRLVRALRLTLEYSLTIGAAILCGYWIVQARW